MIYFTADTHFDHANIIRFCNRPFAAVEEMNETLISNWNRKVHGNDTVYILGDMFFRTTDPEPILRQLKGKKHLITGNHDSQWMKKVDMDRWFASVQPYLETSDGQHTLTMCHFPRELRTIRNTPGMRSNPGVRHQYIRNVNGSKGAWHSSFGLPLAGTRVSVSKTAPPQRCMTHEFLPFQ